MVNDEIELGELRLQYTADSPEAVEELKQLRKTIQREVKSNDHLRAVMNDQAFDNFNAQLRWGGEDD